jgi:hypothetical protein
LARSYLKFNSIESQSMKSLRVFASLSIKKEYNYNPAARVRAGRIVS